MNSFCHIKTKLRGKHLFIVQSLKEQGFGVTVMVNSKSFTFLEEFLQSSVKAEIQRNLARGALMLIEVALQVDAQLKQGQKLPLEQK